MIWDMVTSETIDGAAKHPELADKYKKLLNDWAEVIHKQQP